MYYGKPRKYDSSVELFYENVAFHADSLSEKIAKINSQTSFAYCSSSVRRASELVALTLYLMNFKIFKSFLKSAMQY